MSNFASERYAIGICDRCGRTFKLKKLRNESKNLNYSSIKVCEDCFDKENLQAVGSSLVIRHDTTLKDPAIDNALDQSREIEETIIPEFVATDVNRITSVPVGGGRHYNDLFQTSRIDFGSGLSSAKTLVYTSTSLIRSLCDALIEYPNFRLHIVSATLTVGIDELTETYLNGGSINNRSYSVLKDYDSDTVTWVSFNNGGVPGVDYGSSSVSEGVVGSYSVVWDMASVVQNWLDSNDEDNKGLFFPDMGTNILTTLTDKENVVWNIVARRVVDGY